MSDVPVARCLLCNAVFGSTGPVCVCGGLRVVFDADQFLDEEEPRP